MSSLGLVAAIILAGEVRVIAGVLLMPARQPGSQRGVGCLMIGSASCWQPSSWGICIKSAGWCGGFGVAVFPAISLAGAGIRWLILRARGIEE